MGHLRQIGTLFCAGALLLGAGCGSDSGSPAEPTPVLDQRGHAAGGPLETFRFIDVFDLVFPEGDFCPSFAVHVVGQNRVIVQVYASHLAIHNNYKATLTNLSTGFSLRDPGAWMDIVHLDGEGNAETVTTIGSLFRIVLRGRGIAIQDTGIITFDAETGEVLFQGGPHDAADGLLDYCALLAGAA